MTEQEIAGHMDVVIVQNPESNYSEIILRIPEQASGVYQTKLGLIAVEEVSLKPLRTATNSLGVPGCEGYVTIYLGKSELAQERLVPQHLNFNVS